MFDSRNVSPREEIVLYALYQKDLFGLQIAHCIKECSNGKKEIGFGTLYPVLKTLKDKEFLTIRKESTRSYYKLTDKGIKVIEEIEQFRHNLLHWQKQ